MFRCISTCAFFLGMSFPVIPSHTSITSVFTPEFFQKGKLKDPLSVMGVPSERGSCCLCHVLPRKIGRYRTTAKNEKPANLRIFNVTSRVFCGAREGTRTPKDKPHAPQTCASASSATLAYSVGAVHPTPEV